MSVNSSWLRAPGCEWLEALGPVESAAGSCQGSDQLAGGSALSSGSTLPPSWAGRFRRSLGDWFGWLFFPIRRSVLACSPPRSTLWGLHSVDGTLRGPCASAGGDQGSGLVNLRTTCSERSGKVLKGEGRRGKRWGARWQRTGSDHVPPVRPEAADHTFPVGRRVRRRWRY